MIKKLKDIKIKTDIVTICYARNGHRLYKGDVDNIPSYLLNYYIFLKIINKINNSTYLEVVEDKKWFD